MRKHVWVIGLVLSLGQVVSFAANYAELLASHTRPTMKVIGESVEAIERFHAQRSANVPPAMMRNLNPSHPMYAQMMTRAGQAHPSQLLNPRNESFEPYVNRLIDGAPVLIAAMEKTFPGATWAFVGRDSQLIGDIVEAFYLSLGQEDRVVRIGVSKPTFQNGVSDDLLMRYLADHGLALDEIRTAHPFILVDTISQGYGRQARQMVATVYSHYQARGFNPAALLRKVNIFGLRVSTFSGADHPVTFAEAFLREQEAIYSAGHRADFFDQHQILVFPEPIPLFNESGYEHFTFAWHGPFGPFQSVENGRIETTPGTLSQPPIRDAILYQQAKLHRAGSSVKFLQQVIQEAKKIEYEFPLQRPASSQLEPVSWGEQIPDALKDLFREMQTNETHLAATAFDRGVELRQLVTAMPKPEKNSPSPMDLTENGTTLLNWYRSQRGVYDANRLGLEVFRAARKGRKGLRLRGQDLRAVIREVFADASLSFSLVNEVKDFAEEANAFGDMMRFDDWIIGHPGHKTYLQLKQILEAGESCATLIASRFGLSQNGPNLLQ